MEDAKRVLVTGSAGVIGRAACKALLKAGHYVRGLDLVPSPFAAESFTGSITDADVLRRTAESMHAIIHLAATTDDAPFLETLLPNNIVGVINVLEAARICGVKRVSLASSMQVAQGFRAWHKRVVRIEDGDSPTNGYAATKLFAEAMGHVYWAQHKMEIVCPRLGWLPRNNEDANAIARHAGCRDVWLSHDDAGRFYRRFVEAHKICGKEEGYAVVYVFSKRKSAVGPDLEPARLAIGFEPQDEFPHGLPAEWQIKA